MPKSVGLGARYVNEKTCWPLRWAEATNRFLQRRAGLSLARLDRRLIDDLVRVEHVHEAFGNQDQFYNLLHTFLDGFEKNPHLSLMAHLGITDYFKSNFQARKECMNYVSTHPEVLNQKIENPIVIVGMNRTGTTLLFNLLHQDERSRSTFMYEIYGTWPHMPSASSRAAQYTDPRMALFKRKLDQGRQVLPEGTAKRDQIHATTYDMIEEETIVGSHQLNWLAHVPLVGDPFKDLLFDPDKDFVFKYMKIYFQMLQTGYAPSSHWTLKSPSHLMHIDSFMRSFSDARMVIMHRDPAITVPSMCFLIESIFGSYWKPDTWDRHTLGPFVVELFQKMTQRMMNYRDNHPEKSVQFLDIRFSELEADPISQVQRIYRKFGITYDDKLTIKMKDYLAENKKHKFGKPNYGLAEYGVSPEQIKTAFADYIARYLPG